MLKAYLIFPHLSYWMRLIDEKNEKSVASIGNNIFSTSSIVCFIFVKSCFEKIDYFENQLISW